MPILIQKKAAAPPQVWHSGMQALWQMIHGPWPPERGSWLVVMLAVTQWGRDEVLAHSHSSREGLRSGAVHSLRWLFSVEPITARRSVRDALTHTFVSGSWNCVLTLRVRCVAKAYWGSCAGRAPSPQLPSITLPERVYIHITCIYLMINYQERRIKWLGLQLMLI